MYSCSSFLKKKLSFVSFFTLVCLASSSITFAMDDNVQFLREELVEEEVKEGGEDVEIKPDPFSGGEDEQEKAEKSLSHNHKRKNEGKSNKNRRKKARVGQNTQNTQSRPDLFNMLIPSEPPLSPSESGLERTSPPTPLQNPPQAPQDRRASPPPVQAGPISNLPGGLGGNITIAGSFPIPPQPSGAQGNPSISSYEDWLKEFPLITSTLNWKSSTSSFTTNQVPPASQLYDPMWPLPPLTSPAPLNGQIGSSQGRTPNFANYGGENFVLPPSSAMIDTVPGNSNHVPRTLPEGGIQGGQLPVTTADAHISLPTTTTTTATNTVTNPAPTTTVVTTSNQVTRPSVQTRDPFLEEIDRLIEKAKNQDQEAQDQLIEMRYKANYSDYLTPERLGFNHWSLKDRPELALKERCYNNDKYAFYVIQNHSKIGDAFSNLWDVVNCRAEEGNAAAQFNLGIMYLKGLGVGGKSESNDKIAAEWYTKAANQEYTVAQNNLGIMYVKGQGVEKNYVTGLYYIMSAKKSGAKLFRNFFSAHLFHLPFLGEEKESWKDKCIKITTGKPLQKGEAPQEGLAYLLKRHQDKIAQENAQDFPVPAYTEHYKKVLDIEQKVLNMANLLKTAKPGFMVPGLYFSDEALKHYYTQAEPRQVAHWTRGDTVYLTFGEQNIKIQNSLIAYLDQVDEDFKKADTTLEKLAVTYYDQAECEKTEKDLMTKRHDPEQKEECQRLSEKITKLRGPLNEIEKDRTELSKVHHHLKTLIRSTGQDRQDEFLKEYPFFNRKS